MAQAAGGLNRLPPCRKGDRSAESGPRSRTRCRAAAASSPQPREDVLALRRPVPKLPPCGEISPRSATSSLKERPSRRSALDAQARARSGTTGRNAPARTRTAAAMPDRGATDGWLPRKPQAAGGRPAARLSRRSLAALRPPGSPAARPVEEEQIRLVNGSTPFAADVAQREARRRYRYASVLASRARQQVRSPLDHKRLVEPPRQECQASAVLPVPGGR